MSNQPTYRLHGALLSSNTRRAALTFEYLRVPFELVPVNLRNPDDRARLVALNPNNKIPVLVHGDFVLWESHAIMQYVATQVPGQTVYPTDPRHRADVDRWLFWLSAHFAPPLGVLGWERMWKPLVTGQPTDADQVARHEQAFHAVAKIANEHLDGRDFLAGDGITLADLSMAATVENAAMYKAPLDPYPHVRALHARIAKLPAWAATQPK
jgi:glutathione S-transferase